MTAWHITLSPTRLADGDDRRLSVAVAGDTIILNGAALDLAPLAEGDSLPGAAVAHDFVIGTLVRTGGVIAITLIFPIGYPAPEEARFPQPIIVTTDGPVTLPATGLAPVPEAAGGAP